LTLFPTINPNMLHIMALHLANMTAIESDVANFGAASIISLFPIF